MRWCLLVSSLVVVVHGDSKRMLPNSNTWQPHKPAISLNEQHVIQTRKALPIPDFGGGNQYGGNENEPIDLHNNEFCVDVSTYLPVVWVEKDAQECETQFVKQCSEKSENVCADVTETKCEVVPFKECKSGQEPQEFTETKLTAKRFTEHGCTQGKKTIPHTKLLPECRNVTKQNCVTLWETDKYGKQVWAGTDACEPVTWQECKLVPKDVKFIVPEIKCEPKQELWYHEPEPVTATQLTNTFNCIVKSTTHCTTQTRPDCKQISWNECREVPIVNCSPKSIHIPTQELLHRKKCLLPDNTSPDKYGAPKEQPQPSYGTPAPPTYNSAPSSSYGSAPAPSYSSAPAPSPSYSSAQTTPTYTPRPQSTYSG